MSVLDRPSLEASPLADLHTIASELSMDGYRRLRKSDLIDAILSQQDGAEPSPAALDAEGGAQPATQRKPRTRKADTGAAGDADGGAGRDADQDDDGQSTTGENATGEVATGEAATGEAATGEGATGEGASGEAGTGRRRRGRRGGRGRGAGREAAAADAVDGRAPEPETDAAETADEADDTRDVAPATARARRGRTSSRATAAPAAEPEPEPAAEPAAEPMAEDAEGELVEGVVELLANGSAFIRVFPPDPSDDDVYISAAQVKRCELVGGDRVAGPKRAPRRSERFPSLIRIDSINGRPAAELADGVRYDDLPAMFPTERFRLGSEDPTLKSIEWLTPFGRGSRVTISGGPWAGKSHALRQLAEALAADEQITLFIALAGVRPEEITDWSTSPVAPAGAVSFAASPDAQAYVVELVVEQARRTASRGADAVLLIDTLDGLHLPAARKALASARNLVDSGSLTVIATSTRPLGGETTVIVLDPALTSTRRFPALDLVNSGTLRAELLVGDAGAQAIADARAEAQA